MLRRSLGSGRLPSMLVICATLSVAGCRTRKIDSELQAGSERPSTNYLGHSDYRLLLVGHSGPEFNPNQDLLQPTAVERAREQVAQALQRAALTALIPILNHLRSTGTTENRSIFDGLMSLADNARVSVQKDLRPLLTETAAHLPLVSEAWLVPWTEPAGELFYDAHKISLSPTEAANVLKASPGSQSFASALSERVKTLRSKLEKDSLAPVDLLAARFVLFVAPNKSQLTVRILLGLRSYQTPFVKTDDRVKFRQLVVPKTGPGVSAALTIAVPLDRNESPTLSASFGEFKGLEGGNFVMNPATVHQFAPRLEGEANKTGAGWVALNFSFQELQFNLRAAQVERLSTLVSPGFKIGPARWTVGGIRAASVDQAFQSEINRTIDAEMKAGLERGNDRILGGMLSREILESAFSTIFQREKI